MTFLHLIADYGTGDPAFGEVIHRFKALDDDIDVHPTSVPSFSSIATGFWIAQYGLYNPSFDDLAIYAKTAPRKDDSDPQHDNRGEELVHAELENGTPVIAVDAGHTFSFIRDDIRKLHEVEIPAKGSQFRSRDFFPQAVADLIQGRDRLGAERDIGTIPTPPDETIAHIDGYGNIKTTIRASTIDLDPGTNIEVRIGGRGHEATYTEAAFEVPEGRMAFAPGSTGGKDPFMELFLRGDSAARRFNDPAIGQTVRYSSNT
jgi:S-adenosylmethionine hydrolase